MIRRWMPCAVLALSLFVVWGGTAFADPNPRNNSPAAPTFGTLRPATAEEARVQVDAWLKQMKKTDAPVVQSVETIWKSDRPVLDKVTEVLCLGDPAARKLLDEARNSNAAAPTDPPAILKDASKPAFYRANLSLAYARALSNRRIYEESLAVLSNVRPEQVVDPASFLFHKAVAEHALTKGPEANLTILRLLDDVADPPERYKSVAALMVFDILSWREKDLGSIARKMDNIERRLDLSRGGPTTRKLQKEVIARLDELIKEKENQGNGTGSGNGGNCPGGGNGPPGNTNQPSKPMQDSQIATNSGPGVVDMNKRLKETAEVWGKLPERERAAAMLELTRDMPPRYREVIERYFKELARGENSGK